MRDEALDLGQPCFECEQIVDGVPKGLIGIPARHLRLSRGEHVGGRVPWLIEAISAI